MSEAQENLDDIFEEGLVIDEPEIIEEETEEEKPKTTGYMSKGAWTASGKDPDDWVSEEVFKERGERIKQTSALKREFDNQIKNLSLLHQVQLKNQRDELLSKRDDAIDVADKAAVKSLDKQIKELDDIERLNKPDPVENQNKAPEIIEWEQDNEWSQDPNDPRLKVANFVFQQALSQGKTTATALRMVDKEIASKFSQKSASPRQLVEGNRTAGGKREESMPTMKTLTKDEQKAWDSGLFDDEKDFLKAVANDRKGAK